MNLIYVSQKCRKRVIDETHNKSMTEHFRIEKTLKKIIQNYYFSVIHQEVIKYIQQCDKYNKITESNDYQEHSLHTMTVYTTV